MQQFANEFLQEHALVSLATLSPQGIVENALVYYLTYQDDSHTIYLVVHEKSGKFTNIQFHSQVALAVADQSALTSLQLRGNAFELKDNALSYELIQRYSQVANAQQKDSLPPLIKLKDQTLATVQVKLSWYRYSDFHKNKPFIIEETL